ncbi:MAG: hypothetical protein WBG37_18380 [Desulfobacterales bacterium]
MQIKRFQALNMSEALKQVKAEFGPDAVILSARTIKSARGMFGGLRSRPRVEVTAAIDQPGAEGPYQAKLHTTGGIYRRFPQTGAPAKPGGGPLRRSRSLKFSQPSRSQHPPPPAKAHSDQRHPAGVPDSRSLFALHGHLKRQGLDQALAWDLVARISRNIVTETPLSPDAIAQELATAMGELGAACQRLKITPGHPNLVALVGPTGTGKTTTIAKLAAGALTQGNSGGVALISVDHQRIGAFEQLRSYAEIIGIPMATAMDGESLEAALERFAQHSLILLDTPGIVPSQEDQLDPLAELLEPFRPNVQIVLSAAAKPEDLRDTIYHLRPLRPEGLMFTKLDETATHGGILDAMLHARLPVTYFTHGRQVPEDFQPATLAHLAQLLAPAWESSPAGKRGGEQDAAQLADFEARLAQAACKWNPDALKNRPPPAHRAGLAL